MIKQVLLLVATCTVLVQFISLANALESDGKYIATKEELELVRRHENPDSLPSGLRFDLREPSAWRWKYIEEYYKEFTVLIRENSIDERLSNVIHTITSSKINVDFYNINSGSKSRDEQLAKLVAGKQVDDKVCIEQLGEMLDLMKRFSIELEYKRRKPSFNLNLDESRIRLARVLDSFGRYESGQLAGKNMAQGAPDQCQNSQLLLKGTGGQKRLVQTRYCLAKLNLDKHLDKQLREREKSLREPPNHSIYVGICLPETCHTKSFLSTTNKSRKLFKQLVDSQFELPKSLYLDQHLDLDSIFCPPDMSGGNRASEYSRLPAAGKLFLIVLVSWLLAGTYATYTRNNKSKSENNNNNSCKISRVLKCIDFHDSYNDFILANEETISKKEEEEEEVVRQVDLDTLNPAKVFAGGFVLLCHMVLIFYNNSSNFLKTAAIYETDLIMKPFMVGTLIVDTFFVLTGMLICYITIKKLGSNGQQKATTSANRRQVNQPQASSTLPPQSRSVVWYLSTSAKIFAMRYLRLMPILLVVTWFKKSVFVFAFGSSPLWDFGLNRATMHGACTQTDSLLTPLLLQNSFIPLANQCIGQAWSVTNDLTFMLIVVPIILLMSSKPKVASALLALATLISIQLSLNAFAREKPFQMWELNEVKAHSLNFVITELTYLYSAPQFRFTSICAGILAGYALIWLEQNDRRDPKANDDENNKWLQTIAFYRRAITWLALLLFAIPILGAVFITDLRNFFRPNHHMLFTQASTTVRFAWASANAIFFVRMATDWRNTFLMRQARSRFWKVLTKPVYLMLLTHVEVFHLSLHSETAGRQFTVPRILYEFVAVYFICLPISAAVHLLIENPIDKLIREFLVGSTSSSDSSGGAVPSSRMGKPSKKLQ